MSKYAFVFVFLAVAGLGRRVHTAFNPSVSGRHSAAVRARSAVSRRGISVLSEAIPETVQELLELCTISDYEDTKSSAFDRPEAEVLEVQSRCAQAARLMHRAVKQEDYDTASTIMSQLCELRQLDPVWKLHRELEESVSLEDFEQAAQLQSDLTKLREARPRLMWRNELLVLSKNGRRLEAAGWNTETGEQTRRELMTAPAGCKLQQPTWEPSGEWLAVAQISGDGKHRVLVISASDGTVLGSVATPPVFFFQWGKAQSGRQTLTFLHSSPTDLLAGGAPIVLCACELQIVRLGSTLSFSLSERRCVRTGGPLYYSIGDNDELLSNNGFFNEVSFSESGDGAAGGDAEARFATGNTMQLQNSASTCRAPVLTPDGSHAIYCETSRPLPFALPTSLARLAKLFRGNSVVAVEVKTGRKKRLLKVPAYRESILQLSPDGTRLAVIRSPGALVEAEPQTNQPRARWPVLVLEATSPAGLVGGRTTEWQLVTPKMFTIASWFSPDSRKLLCLDVRLDISGEGRFSPSGKPLPRVSWTVWTFGNGAPTQVTYDPWVLSNELLRVYVPYFDQYSVAGVSPWSPDSSAFCYTDELGNTRVQWLDDTPRKLTDFLKPTAEVVATDVEGAVVSWWSPC